MESSLRIALIGGSGFVSGTLAREALSRGHEVWAVSRGQRPVVPGVNAIQADRKDTAATAAAFAALDVEFDLAVDCIGYDPEDVVQDIALFRDRARHLVFISTDFVYDPPQRTFPQKEENARYLTDDSYGARKRRSELELVNGDTGAMRWSVVRPCHIYGPGSLLGCLPDHGRDPELIDKMRAGTALKLVGGGHFLQQPIFVGDLANVILSCANSPSAHEAICNTAGPDIAESSHYYQIIADVLGVDVSIEELPVGKYRAEHPERESFLCHRINSMERLRECGLCMPSMPLADGLALHVASLTEGT